MNKAAAEAIEGFAERIDRNLFSGEMEKNALSDLLLMSGADSICLIVLHKTSGDEAKVYSCDSSGFRSETVSAAHFRKRFSFSISSALSGAGARIPGTSNDPAERIFVRDTTGVRLIAIVRNIRRPDFLTDDVLSLAMSIVGLALHARYAVLDNAEATLRKIAESDHRIKGVLSSIRTAVEMLISEDLTTEEELQLKRLARAGVFELADIVENIAGSSKAGNRQKIKAAGRTRRTARR
ncbi:MAG: hypothetical protein M0024_10950 [Nitrospiraceae bacterium]|nr:hypothetical protein [Nitrospiraceae bacterium]